MTAPRDRTRLQLGVAAVLAIGMLVFCALRLRVNNDVMHFMPAGTDHRLANLSRQLADSTLTRTMILDIGGSDPEALRAAAAAIAAGLAAYPEVAWVERGPTPALAEAVYKLYGQRLPYFVSDHPQTEVPARSPTRRWNAPRAPSSNGWRSRWRRCSRGWRRQIRCSGSRRSCAASNARGPDRWMSTAISS